MRSLRPKHRLGITLAATLAILAGCGGVAVDDPGRGLIERYCSYGAVSRPQLRGCIEHVTPDDVARLRTNAARYARGQLDRCLADAGPFCTDD